MEKIKCYYWDDYIKIEKENPLFMETIEDDFINIIQYPLKIDKKIFISISL